MRFENDDFYLGHFNTDNEFEGSGVFISQENGVQEGTFGMGEYLGGKTNDAATRKNSTNVFLTHAKARTKFLQTTQTFSNFNSIEPEKEELNLNEFFSAI